MTAEAAVQLSRVLARLGHFDWPSTKRAIEDRRWEARREARAYGKKSRQNFTRSRGTFLCTCDANGQCAPYIAAEGPVFNGTKKEIEEIIAACEGGKYPNVTEVYIEGGFDVSDRMDFDDYEPRASEWEITIWKRGDGYVNHTGGRQS